MNRHSEFDRGNLAHLDLSQVRAHEGDGLIRFARVVEKSQLAGGCNFIDVGPHTHRSTEEEFYLVLAGTGEMTRNGEVFRVEAGDLIRNPPGGTHSLRNSGAEPLKIFVFELEVRP